jgi:hypothetical protein
VHTSSQCNLASVVRFVTMPALAREPPFTLSGE